MRPTTIVTRLFVTLLIAAGLFLPHASVPVVRAASLSVQINQNEDDAEQLGVAPFTLLRFSSDLETEQGGDPQHLGFRFNSVAIPPGATLTSATMRLVADGSSTVAGVIYDIHGIDEDNASPWVGASGITSRPQTTAFATWNLPTNIIGGTTYTTVDFTAAVQEIIDRPGWVFGNSLSIALIANTVPGRHAFVAHDNTAVQSAFLDLTFDTATATPTETSTSAIPATSTFTPAPTGTSTVTATPTETPVGPVAAFITSASCADDGSDVAGVPNFTNATEAVVSGKILAFRFQSVSIPQGSNIQDAYITVESDTTDATLGIAFIDGEQIDDSPAFGVIAGRERTDAQRAWSMPAFTMGNTFDSADLSNIIREIVNRPGWASGQSLTLFMNGFGSRVIRMCESGATIDLSINYVAPVSFTPTPVNTPTAIPTHTATPTFAATSTLTPTPTWTPCARETRIIVAPGLHFTYCPQ